MSLRLPEHFLKQESFLEYCMQSEPGAVAYWENYVRLHPGEEAAIAEAKQMFLESRNLIIAEQYKPAAVAAMRGYLEANTTVTGPGIKPIRRVSISRWAAAAAILMAIGLSWWWIGRPARQGVLARQHFTQKPTIYFYAAGHDRKGFTLADGSFVLLEDNATLRIDSAFGKEERTMYLTGTAWFNVAKDKAHAFKVITGDYVTIALGTAFRIRQQQHNAVKIELEEGKVLVEKNNKGAYEILATLLPSESIIVGAAGNTVAQKATFSVPQLKAWKAQEIIFDKAPLPDVLSQLEQVYDLQISVQDTAVLKETFTGRFHQDAFKDVLDIICFSLNKQYKISDGNKVLIY